MTLQDLFNKINNGEEFKKELIKRTYIPFAEKMQIIDTIIDVITYDEDGLLMVDTNELEMNAVIAFIQAYTNLTFDDGIKDYDFIMEHSLQNTIYSAIGHDVLKLHNMLDNKLHDVMQQNSLESIVNRYMSNLVDAFIDTVNKLNEKIKEVDVQNLRSTLANEALNALGTSK